MRVRKSQERGKRLIVSLKSEEELVRSAKIAALWLTVGASVALAAAIVTIILGIMKR